MKVGDDIEPTVRFSGVTKRLPDFTLSDVCIDVYPGEVHALTGENGSGKSVLMRMLSGWHTPDSGTIEFPRHDSAPHVSYVDQDVQTFDNLTVAENVFFNRSPNLFRLSFLIDQTRVLAECYNVFEELGISISPQARMGTLGYAERQLVNSVRALVDDAPLAVFDAATTAMTEPDRELVYKLVRRLQHSGSAIFLISHRVQEIMDLANRVSVLDHGRLTATREVATMSSKELVRTMTGEIHERGYPHLRSSPGPVMMKVRNLCSPPVLNDVSFDVRRGEILGITGLMGSGRTRLAGCLFGLIEPTSGVIELDDRPVALDSPSTAMTYGISLIPEDRLENGIFPQHDLVFNITLAALERFAHNSRLDDLYMREMVRKLAGTLDIKPRNQTDRIDGYSGGNQQKVLIARWLATRTRLCIMDEPTRGTDVASRVDIYNAINDLVNSGVSVLLISSEIEEILGMSDRLIVLAGGVIAAEMTRNEATKERIIACAAEDGHRDE